MTKKRGIGKGTYLMGGLLLVSGYVLARLAHRALARPEEVEDLDDNAPSLLTLRRNERRYPPFYDGEVVGARVEGEFDEEGARQLVVIGIDQTELDAAMQPKQRQFAVARCDGAGLWHPAVAESALWYGKATDQHGDVYALAAYVGPSILQLLPGTVEKGHFTAFKSTRILALTNADGLSYDYPNVPILEIID